MPLHNKTAPRADRGKNITIETAKITLGGHTVLIGLTDGKICFAGFTGDENVISTYYPKAELKPYAGNIGYLQDKLQNIWQQDRLNDADIYVEGTTFQINVWKQLLKIKAGGPLNYADIAKNLNRPKAFRAVGNAVGSNPVSIFIPCHRVVHASGDRMGYAWGVDVKQDLLKAEAA